MLRRRSAQKVSLNHIYNMVKDKKKKKENYQ